jgi:hypothetical protein
MTKYKQRKRNLYENNSDTYAISRSKIDLFINCPRCFYLDRKLGLAQPSMPGWPLNSAVDYLLKQEFDYYRKLRLPHPIMVQYGIDAVPFSHPDLPFWRDDVYHYVGASVVDEQTGFQVQGIIDDVWITPQGELNIVDYKATSTASEISLDDEFKQSYKRQMEVYQWIFRKMGFKVSPVGYFVFANALKDRKLFDNKLEFELTILTHHGEDSWVSPTLMDMKAILESDTIPEANPDCEYCEYRRLTKEVE